MLSTSRTSGNSAFCAPPRCLLEKYRMNKKRLSVSGRFLFDVLISIVLKVKFQTIQDDWRLSRRHPMHPAHQNKKPTSRKKRKMHTQTHTHTHTHTQDNTQHTKHKIRETTHHPTKMYTTTPPQPLTTITHLSHERTPTSNLDRFWTCLLHSRRRNVSRALASLTKIKRVELLLPLSRIHATIVTNNKCGWF